MQVDMEEHWDQVVDIERQPDRLGEFGFNNPIHLVKMVGQAFYYSKGVALPESGGVLDQDLTLMEDIFTYLAGLGRAQWVWNEVHKPTENKGQQ